MSKQLAKTLKALGTDQKREALAKGRELPELVLVNGIGKILEERNQRTLVFWPALAKAGLRRIRIHDRAIPLPASLSKIGKAWPT
jgi:hypothetical protein